MNFYKVGDIFLTVNSDNPGDRFTGTWTLIAKGRTLVGVDSNDSDFNTVEKTGGSKYLQRHSHSYNRNVSPSYETVFISGNSTSGMISQPSGYGLTAGYASIGEEGTGNSGNLQPYFTCYIWCRTA